MLELRRGFSTLVLFILICNVVYHAIFSFAAYNIIIMHMQLGVECGRGKTYIQYNKIQFIFGINIFNDSFQFCNIFSPYTCSYNYGTLFMYLHSW